MLEPAVSSASLAAPSGKSGPFQHPGMLHSAADLRFVREKIKRGEEPWNTAWKNLLADKIADPTVHPSGNRFRIGGTKTSLSIVLQAAACSEDQSPFGALSAWRISSAALAKR